MSADGAGLPPPVSDREDLTPDQARLLPFYHDLRNEIVEPDKVVVTTQYFWTRWAPRLGPTLTVLVVCLRRHCYYNRATQERRDWCFPEQATLAREIGVETTKTIRAALSHPLARQFVRREARYVYDPARAKKVRTSDLYYVAMDDPLTPEDEALLALRAAERLLAEGRRSELIGPSAPRQPDGQNDPQVTRRSTGRKGPQVPRSGGETARQDSAALFTHEVVHEESTHTTKYGDAFTHVLHAFAAANNAPTTPAQLARLEALCRQFEEPARRHDHASSGTAWVLAAIEEAVESGSHFVAPRRIARICERWSAEGGPSVTASLPTGAGQRVFSPLTAGESGGVFSPLTAGEGQGEGRSLLSAPDSDVQEPRERMPLTLTLSRGERGEEAPPPREREREAPSPRGREREGLSSRPRERDAPTFPELGLPGRAVWQAVCDEALRRLTSPGDVALLAGSQLVGRDAHFLIIGVPGRSTAQRAEARLTPTLGPVIRLVLGHAYEPRFVSVGDWDTRPESSIDASNDSRVTNA